jgi:hypothetical protein
MTTIRTAALALAIAALAVTASGCAGSTTADSSPAAATPEATATAAAEALPEPTGPPPSTCPEFLMTAAHMATDWQYLNLNLGTTNDEGPTLADLRDGSAALQDLAPTCAPEAVDEVDAFAATVGPVLDVYTTQPTGDEVATVDTALADMQTAGASLFTALEMATYSWE